MRNIQHKIDAITLHRSWLHHIKNDVFNISNRIREIDDGYFIVRNVVANKFEVHNVDTKGPSTYEFTIPFDKLDCRTLDFCRKTLIANKEKILKELEAQNIKRENEYKKRVHSINEDMAMQLADDLRRAI